MPKNRIIKVQNIPITIAEADMDDYICITDMAGIRKWHKIQPGKELSQVQKEYLVDVIMTWIEKELSYYDSQM